MKSFHVMIRRQPEPKAQSYWEAYDIQLSELQTVAQLLQFIQKRSVNRESHAVTPVAWEVSSHTMLLINGQPRLPHEVYLKDLQQPVRIAPLRVHSVIRDLVTEDVLRRKAIVSLRNWAPLDGFGFKGQDHLLVQSQGDFPVETVLNCIGCNACQEVCPNTGVQDDFFGPISLAESLLYQKRTQDLSQKSNRLQAWQSQSGVVGCDNTQNCQRACPSGVALVDLIGMVKRETYRSTSLF